MGIELPPGSSWAEDLVWPEQLADRYAPLQVLGCGGRSVVVEARDETGRLVAVKLPRSSDMETVSRVYRKILRREAFHLARLRHEGVVRILGADSAGHFIVLERHSHISLKALRANCGFPFHSILKCVAALSRALAHVHANDLLHLDLKPQNILLRGSGIEDPVLVDFGSSRSLRKLLGPGTLDPAKLGSGKYRFKAPEQLIFLRERFGPETDAFGIGATLYWLMSGKDAYSNHLADGSDAWSFFRTRWHSLETEVSRTGLSESGATLLCSLLAPVPEDRPARLEEVAVLLEREADVHHPDNS